MYKDKTLRILHKLIIKDLSAIGIDCMSFELILKPYSKTYYGRYSTLKKRLVIYVYSDKERSLTFEYKDLMNTAIHEVCHHLQWSDPDWKRVKGVMHNKEFWEMYHNLCQRYKDFKSSKDKLYLKPFRRIYYVTIHKENSNSSS